jgi:glycosyltransferase involved in cell wall biosynthesis
MDSDSPHVLVDGRVIDHPTAGGRGVGRYTIGFVRALVHSGMTTTVMCATVRQKELWQNEIAGVLTAPLRRDSLDGISADTNRWFVCTQLMLHPIPLDVIPRFITEAGVPVVAIVHDVIPHRHPERYLTDPFAAVQTRLRSVAARSVDLLLANSTFTADTAAIELGVNRARITVVGAAVEPQFVPGPVDPMVMEALGIAVRPRPVVAVTGADPRKNTDGLIRAWSRVEAGVRAGRSLVIACAAPPDVLDHWQHLAAYCGVSDAVVATGSLSDEQMVALLRAAECTVLPSLEEGFGLPIAESVACGTPALCSATSSMPEVAGCHEALFDPYDTEDMAGCLAATLSDASRRGRIFEAERRRLQRWTLDGVAQSLGAALMTVPTPRVRGRGSHTSRVAIAAPPPQSVSGIGRYTSMIIDAWEVPDEVVALDDLSCADGRHRAQGTAVGAGSLGRRLQSHDFDHMVLVAGSSEFHAVTAERARLGGAHIWLHEPTLVGAHLGAALRGGGDPWFHRRMDELGIDVPPGHVSAEVLHASSIDMLAPIVVDARSLIVSSVDAVSSIQESMGGRPLPPVLVLPLAHPVRERVAGGVTRRAVALGWLSDGPSIRLLLDAVSKVPNLQLDLVGGLSRDLACRLESMIANRSLHERVRVHGRISDHMLDRVLADASVGVRLGSGHRGQMSASITEFLARGIPVVTDLVTHGTSSPGLHVIEPPVEADVLAEVLDLVTHPDHTAGYRDDAYERAARWRPVDAARALRSWLSSADSMALGTVECADEVRS